jgi:hypothetical protein
MRPASGGTVPELPCDALECTCADRWTIYAERCSREPWPRLAGYRTGADLAALMAAARGAPSSEACADRRSVTRPPLSIPHA